MPLIPFAEVQSLPEEARMAYERLPNKLNIFRVWANAPESFVAGARMAGTILGRQKLAAPLRELLILLTAKLDGGSYEWGQHVPVAEAAGCSKAQIAAIEGLRLDEACFAPEEKVLLSFARAVVVDVRAPEELVMAMQAHFSPQEIVETIITCGFYMMLARLTETTRTEHEASGGLPVLNALVGMS